MTMLSALLIAVVPTGIGLTLLGINDPKQRRLTGIAPAPERWRQAGIGLCLLSGIFIVANAGLVTLLIWIAALAPIGWILTNSLSRLFAASRSVAGGMERRTGQTGLFGSRALSPLPPMRALYARANYLRASGRRTLEAISRALARADQVTLLLLGVMLYAIVTASATLALWQLGSANNAALQRQVAMQAIHLFMESSLERKSTMSCFAAINNSLNSEAAVRNLLSGRALSISFQTVGSPDTGDVDLQRCMLANGDDSAIVGQDETTHRETFALETSAGEHIRNAITSQLTNYEMLTAVYEETYNPSGFICRQITPLINPEIYRFVELLRQNRLYAKVSDLLERIPSLDRLTNDVPDPTSCPT